MGAYAAARIGILFAFSASAVLLALLPFAFGFADLAGATIWTSEKPTTVGALWEVSPISGPSCHLRYAA